MDRRIAHDNSAVIYSSDNPSIKLVRSLRQRKTREAERLFLVEGERLIEDMFGMRVNPRLVFLREDQAHRAENLANLAIEPFEIKIVAQKLFDSLSDTVTPQGILALVPFLTLSPVTSEKPLIVVVDSMTDPGNLGTLLRVAAGAGATIVYLTKGAVDPYNPKVVRAGMGAHFRIPIAWLDETEKSRIISDCPTRVLADASGEIDYENVDWTSPVAVLLGPETGGFSVEIRELATTRVRIPLQNTLESLNAAVAGAVILFEANRQRRTTHLPK